MVTKMKSTIRLFKAIPIASKRRKNPSEYLLKLTASKGFIFSPEVVYNHTEEELVKLAKVVVEEFGITAEQLNSAFHKSWNKIKEASNQVLAMEQIVHYLTTYGFQEAGIFNHESVFIPKEKLDIPGLEDNINLIVIKGYTKEELKEKLLIMLSSGIALSEDTINDIKEVLGIIELTVGEICTVRNKEVQAIAYDLYGLVPEVPTDFLRYLVYKATDKTLLIKSRQVIDVIKEGPNVHAAGLFDIYSKMCGLERLSTIFYRFKPLFLAFKQGPGMKPYINKLRRLAKKHHKPMEEDYLNTLTSKIKNDNTIIIDRLQEELDKVNTFRKIRLAYALKFRTTDCESILYKVRNGKGYATEFKFKQKGMAKKILDIVVESIIKDIGKNVKGKRIFIPESMNYMLPATEKQFTGNYPNGSYVSVDSDMIVGINWKNVDGKQIDLDLSMLNPITGKIGWDSCYRTEDRNISFSGDITYPRGPNGVTELLYVSKQIKNSYIMLVN